MSFTFFLILWGFSSVVASEPDAEIVNVPAKKMTELESIDSQLEELEEMKRGFDSRALRHDNQAEYLQFDQQANLETRRHLEIAEENRQKAALVQQRIDALKARREQLSQ